MRPLAAPPPRRAPLVRVATRVALAAFAALASLVPLATARAATGPEPVVLMARGDFAGIDLEALRRAIEQEIGAPVIWELYVPPEQTRRRLAIIVHAERAELAVTYDDRRRGTVSRVVPAPRDPYALVDRAVWLAGNLARDEAAELLDAARPPAVAPPAPPVPVPAPPGPAGPPAAVTVQGLRPADARPFVPVVVSLFFPLANNAWAPDARAHLGLSLVYGRVGVLHGLQLGFVNQVTAEVLGGQFGTVNLAGDVRGAQLGLVNVAARVRGLQFGLVNVADEVDGIPIGLVSVTRSGGVHPVVWSSAATFANVGIKFSTRHTFTQFNGTAADDQGTRMYGPGFAFGLRLPRGRWAFEGDLWGAYVVAGPLSGVTARQGLVDDMAMGAVRGRVTFELHRHFSLFAGVALMSRTRFYQGPDEATTVRTGPDVYGGIQL